MCLLQDQLLSALTANGGETATFDNYSGNNCAYKVPQNLLVSVFPAESRRFKLVPSRKVPMRAKLRTKIVAELEADFKNPAKSPDVETNPRCLNVCVDHL